MNIKHLVRGWYFEEEGVPAEPPPAAPAVPSEDLGYRAGIKGELKDNEYLKGFGNVTELSQSAVDNHKELAELKESLDNRILKPGENASEEEIAAYHKALGVPEDVKGYELDGIKIPDELKEVEEHLNLGKWVDTFKKLNVPKEMAQELIGAYLENTKSQLADEAEAKVQRTKDTLDELNTAWGKDAPGNTEVAKRALDVFASRTPFPVEKVEAITKGEFGDHPVVIALFNEVYRAIGDDSFFAGDKGGGAKDADTRPRGRAGQALLHKPVKK